VPLLVDGDVSGIRVVLEPMEYAWTGVVSDGLDGQPFGQATVYVDQVPAATTDANGSYTLDLENGTYAIGVAVVGAPSNYALASFSLVVDGSGGVRDVPIFPPTFSVDVRVVDEVTGLPIQGASVVVNGTIYPEGIAAHHSASTDASGESQVSVYNGSYNVMVSATGFLPRSETVLQTGAGPVGVIVSLSPRTVPTSGGPGVSPVVLDVLIAGAILVAAMAAYVIVRKRTAVRRG
jgi:hypothetical protein